MRLGVREASQASFRRQLFTDATIEVDGRVWAVHRATLACASPVFESMFSSNMLEGERPEAVEAVSAVHTMCAPKQELIQKSAEDCACLTHECRNE